MTNQTVLWTAVPDGIDGDQARLVCVVSPRLTNAGWTTVAQWPEWRTWAQPAGAITFAVRLDGGPAIPATRVSPAPEPARWAALVQPELPVIPFAAAGHADHRIRSYPAGNIADFIAQKYGDVAATSPTEFPTIGSHLDGGVGQVGLAFNPAANKNLRGQLGAALAAAQAVPPGPPQPVADFLQAHIFHEVDPNISRQPPANPPFDFHQLLTVLTQYPALQRRLGLVFDLRIPAAAVAGAHTVQVIPSWTPATAATVVVSPLTALTSSGFRPAPRAGSDLDSDRLTLSAAGWKVVGADLDSAALTLRRFADEIRRTQLTSSADTPDRASLPALRSAGLAVARTGRATAQVQRFAAAAAREQTLAGGGPVTLDADALLYGLRWSVYDTRTARWYSLCERRGTYAFLRDRSLDLTLDDAGVVTTAVTQRGDAALAPDYYLAEYVCRWTGESLVASRPGAVLDADPARPPTTAQSAPPTTAPMQVRFAPRPGTLPPLRFGRTYRMRATAAYLGGAGPVFDPADTGADPAHASAAITYARLEPVPPPVVVARAPRVPGESLHHLVIRSEADGAASATVATERHIVPPKTSQLLAETHGMFDTGQGLDPAAYAAIAARAGASVDTGGVPDPSEPSQRYHDVDKLSFGVEDGRTTGVPWLPDPLARGAALNGLPGATAANIVEYGYSEGRTWRTAQPFRLKLVEGTAAPAFDPLAGVLTVSLGKGDTAAVALSSELREEDLPLLQVWQWLLARLSPAELATHRGYATSGRHWMLTPAQPLTLVHAVRRPLVAPKINATTIGRTTGTTAAVLAAPGMTISRKSTISVDVSAWWTEPVDTLDATGWHPTGQTTKRAHLGTVPVPAAGPDATFDLSIRHELGDTKFHQVYYFPTANSRFAEYFTEPATASVTVPADGSATVDPHGVTPRSETVTAGGVTFQRDRDYELTADGQIRRIPTGTLAGGTGVSVSYLPSTAVAGPPAVVSVPASARPIAPSPRYVVPTFGWNTTSSASGVDSTRSGGGLRVYLDRPWWSSGDGELLGVVLWSAPANATTVDPDIAPYVTLWGRDPLYQAAATPHLVPTLADFPRALVKRGGLLLAERNVTVAVAGHAVQADPQRQLWYCDIDLPPGRAHLPFVRLALARFQPVALPGADLSPVVHADIAQLAPDRTASVLYGTDPGSIRVGVVGSAYALSADGQKTATMTATIEVTDPAVPGELGWTAAGAAQPLPAQALSTGDMQWRGTVTLPAARGSRPMRLVLREFDDPAGHRPAYVDVLPLS